jgi:hypothetical protein
MRNPKSAALRIEDAGQLAYSGYIDRNDEDATLAGKDWSDPSMKPALCTEKTEIGRAAG